MRSPVLLLRVRGLNGIAVHHSGKDWSGSVAASWLPICVVLTGEQRLKIRSRGTYDP